MLPSGTANVPDVETIRLLFRIGLPFMEGDDDDDVVVTAIPCV
jgi:predicted PolB exonuclease-like 3'-5' exonuclease